jgi:hypothetical protein
MESRPSAHDPRARNVPRHVGALSPTPAHKLRGQKLKEGRTCGSAEQNVANAERCVSPFIASPREEQVDNRQPSRVHRQPYGIAATEVAEVDVTARQRRLRGINAEIGAKRNLRKSVFHRPAEKHEVRSTEAVVRVAGKDRLAVNIRAACGWVEVERDSIARSRCRAGQEHAKTDRALVVDGAGDVRAACARVSGARVGAIMRVGGSEIDLACKWELMTDIGGPAHETVGGATQADEILDMGEVVQAEPAREEAGLDLDSAARLKKCGGAGEAGCRRLGVDLADRRDRLVEIAAQLRHAAIELKSEGDAVAIQREDSTRTGDGFGEAKGGLTPWRSVGAEAVKVEEVERSGFRINIKYRRDLDGM